MVWTLLEDNIESEWQNNKFKILGGKYNESNSKYNNKSEYKKNGSKLNTSCNRSYTSLDYTCSRTSYAARLRTTYNVYSSFNK